MNTQIIIFVIVLLALLGVGIYFLTRPKTNGNTTDQTDVNVTPTGLYRYRSAHNCLCACSVAGPNCKPYSQWKDSHGIQIGECTGNLCFF